MDSEKVLLVSPAGRAASQRPPFALMCIASYLEKNAIPTDIIDIKGYEPKEKITSEILSEIKKRDADIIGTTCLTTELREILELCREIKILKPDAKIIAGGIHPSLIPEELVFRNSPVDFAVMGEGEQTFLELVQAIRKDSNVAGVKGIAWHKNSRLAKTPARPYIKDLDLLPFPAFDKIDMKFYTKPDFYCIRGIPIAGFYTYTSRGCPYRCRF
ncbi:MAG: cobalamin-dependent protein, partial [Candidatus Diapherotrites archaeon]|nr:cobalamin-dependent protein [Candidatus Diapherotrites archaeon]